MQSSPRRAATYALAISALLVVSTLAASALLAPPGQTVDLRFPWGPGFGVQSAHDGGNPPPLLHGDTDPNGTVHWVRNLEVGPAGATAMMVSVHVSSLEESYVEIGGVERITFRPVLEAHDETVGPLYGTAPPIDPNALLEDEEEPEPTESEDPEPLVDPEELLGDDEEEPEEPSEPDPTPIERLCGTGAIAPEPGMTTPWTCRLGTENTSALLTVEPTAERATLVLDTGDETLTYTITPYVVYVDDDSGNLVDLIVRNPLEQASYPGAKTLEVPHTYCDGEQCWTLRDAPTDDFACTGECDDGHYRFVIDPSESLPTEMPGTLLHVWSHDAEHDGVGLQLMDSDPIYLEAPYWTGNPLEAPGLTVSQPGVGTLARVQVNLPDEHDRSFGFELEGPAVLGADGVGHSAEELEEVGFTVGALGDEFFTDDEAFAMFDSLAGTAVATWKDADGEVRKVDVYAIAGMVSLATIQETAEGTVQVVLDTIDSQLNYTNHTISEVSDDANGLIVVLEDTVTQEADAAVRFVRGTTGCERFDQGCLTVLVGGLTEGLPPSPVTTDDLPDPTGTDPAGGLLDNDGGNDDGGNDGDGDPILGDDGDPVGMLLGDQPIPGGDTLVAYVNTVRGTMLGLVPDPEATDPATCIADLETCVATLDPQAYRGAAIGFLEATQVAATALVDQANEEAVSVYDPDGDEIVYVSGGRISAAGLSAVRGNDPFLTLTAPDDTTVCIDHTATETSPAGGTLPSFTLGCPGDDEQTVLQPGLTMEWNQRERRLASLVVADPTDPDTELLSYSDDGDTMTLSSAADNVAGSWSHDSRLVTIDGNPVTQNHFTIGVQGEVLAPGVFDSVTVLKQVYDAGRPLAGGVLPDGLANLVFSMVEPPSAQVTLDAGRIHLDDARGGFDGSAWTSGQYNHHLTALVKDSRAPERAELVYRIARAPTPDHHERVALPIAGYSDSGTERTHVGTIGSEALSAFQDGTKLRMALAWTERAGPVAVTLWDDHSGALYNLTLDNHAPDAHLDAPASVSSDDATFAVSWTGNDDASGLSQFHVRYAAGSLPDNDTGWTPWVEGRSVNEGRDARFQGTSGATYHFQVRASDRAGNLGEWGQPRTVSVASVSNTLPPALELAVSKPTDGATLEGDAALAWSVTGGGNADPMVTVQARDDTAGGAWRTLYSGTAGTATWRTTDVYDGTYTLRFTAHDGASTARETLDVSIDNGRERPTLDAVSGGSPDVNGDGGTVGDDAPPGDDKDSPGPGLLLALVTLAGLAVALRRRRD